MSTVASGPLATPNETNKQNRKTAKARQRKLFKTAPPPGGEERLESKPRAKTGLGVPEGPELKVNVKGCVLRWARGSCGETGRNETPKKVLRAGAAARDAHGTGSSTLAFGRS